MEGGSPNFGSKWAAVLAKSYSRSLKIIPPVGHRSPWVWHHAPVDRRRENAAEGGRAHGGMSVGRALAASGFPALGVALGNLLTRGFSLRDP